ncbi:SPFH domain-containing protein [bacterium]|nr:SPFH domain-containing protein [bacterium]
MGSLLTAILSIVFFPITLLGSWITVHPQEEKVVLFWGKLDRVLKSPGLYFYLLFGRRVIPVTTKQQAIELHKTTVADANANPIIVAGICTFRVVDSEKAALQVEDYQSFVKSQAVAVLKQVASKYPYESPDGHGLKDEAQAVSREMVQVMSAKVASAGVEVISFELSDLSYAPEIAQAMLVRQQAQALVGARRIIVEGAVEIVKGAIEHLEQAGIPIDKGHQSRVVGNLLAIICGEAKVQPTYDIQNNESDRSNEQLAAVIQRLEGIQKALTAKNG